MTLKTIANIKTNFYRYAVIDHNKLLLLLAVLYLILNFLNSVEQGGIHRMKLGFKKCKYL